MVSCLAKQGVNLSFLSRAPPDSSLSISPIPTRAIGERNAFAIPDDIDLPFGIDPSSINREYDSNLGARIDRFQARAADPITSVAKDSAAILFIGPNDFSDTFGDFADQSPFIALFTIAAIVDESIATVSDAAVTIAGEGVGTIFLGTLPVGIFFGRRHP